MKLTDLDYELPAAHIAAQPAEPRDSARLMVVERATGRIEHHRVGDLPRLGLLQSGDLLVFNRSKVIPARFFARRRNTNGQVEGLYLHTPLPQHPQQCLVMLESRGTLREGEFLVVNEEARLKLLEKKGAGHWLVEVHAPCDMLTLLDSVGLTPLPPYILRERKVQNLPEFAAADSTRYNTVYAADPGSVAAPTAGLHFTPQLLDQIWSHNIHCAWVTLHVGLGTFAPVRSEFLADHPMHAEWFSVPADTVTALRQTRERGNRIIPVGTTSVRALESLPADLDDCAQGHVGWTNLFIYPQARQPFRFRFTDQLMTNFHLPRSTLLALVAALPGVGLPRLKQWYVQAITEGYRFYSYGDAMWLV